MDDNKKLIEKIRELLKKLGEAIRKRKQEKRDGKLTPAVFERELKAVEKKLEQFEEQDDIHTDALRDVAETLEKITGSIENGELRNASIEEIAANMENVSKKVEKIAEKGREPFTVSSTTLEDVLKKTFGNTVKTEDFYTASENGERLLSPNVKFAFDKQEGKAADVYMILDGANCPLTALKIKVNKKDGLEKIGFDKVPVSRTVESYRLNTRGNEKSLELMPLDSLRSLSIQEVIGESLFQSSEEYMKARMQKGYKMAEEWKSISGTKDSPFTMDEFQCINDDTLGYCIKDRIHDTMIALKFNKEDRSFTANFFSNVTEGFNANPKDGETVMKIQKVTNKNGHSNLKYSVSTSPNADIILDTPMAQKALHMALPNNFDFDRLNDARKKGDGRFIDETGGEFVKGANRDKIIMLRNEIETQLRSQKGLDGYFVGMKSMRHGKETQIVISAPDKSGKSEYTINFDKQGNIKAHLWSSYDITTGKRSKPEPVVKAANNFVNKVLDKELFSKNELCVCYQVVKDSLQAVDERLKEQGFSFSQNMEVDTATNRFIYDNSFLEQWADLAGEAILANRMKGKLDDAHELVNLILNQAEIRDGVYPNADYKEALVNNVNNLYYTLSEKGIIDDAFSKSISYEYAGREKDSVQHFEAVGYSSAEAQNEAAQEYAQMAGAFEEDPFTDEAYREMARQYEESEAYMQEMMRGGWNVYEQAQQYNGAVAATIPDDYVPEPPELEYDDPSYGEPSYEPEYYEYAPEQYVPASEYPKYEGEPVTYEFEQDIADRAAAVTSPNAPEAGKGKAEIKKPKQEGVEM